MDETERLKGLFCTPDHITKALLKREPFGGSIWEPCAGRGDIVTVLRDCGYRDVMASDIENWGFQPCETHDFLRSNREADCIITNPPFDRTKAKFLVKAKKLARHKIALLLPLAYETTVGFAKAHVHDEDFPLKAIYAFLQPVHWKNAERLLGGKLKVAWFVFERGYAGHVVRDYITFSKNRRATTKSLQEPRKRRTKQTKSLANAIQSFSFATS